jgi:hypothetical protein
VNQLFLDPSVAPGANQQCRLWVFLLRAHIFVFTVL